MGWAWDQAAGRYKDTDPPHHYLPFAQVREWNAKGIAASQNVNGDLAGMVTSGQINIADWETEFREQIKRECTRQYLVGIGGEGRMTQADWGSIGGMLKEQYHPHLDDFRREITMGNLSEAQIRARMDMYINSAREAYERAQAKVAKKTEKTEEKWQLGNSEHCDDCIAFDAEGWQPIGHFPAPGAGKTACLTNCQCHKEYR